LSGSHLQYIAPSGPNGQLFVNQGGVLSSILFGSALFTTGADTVDFTHLTSAQQSAGAPLYNGLGGSDVVVLPSVANYNESLGNTGGTLNWNPASTFQTGSLVGDTYSVTGSDGNYDIALGSGTDTVSINGNGNSNIIAGGGTDIITINGTGHSIITPGSGTLNATIGGGGIVEFTSTTAPVTGSITFAPGVNETLQIDGTTMPTIPIDGFAAGDNVDLQGFCFSSLQSAQIPVFAKDRTNFR
jgi:hypothetical protein